MARTPPEKIAYARMLLESGQATSKRTLERAVKEQFGRGIGHETALGVLREHRERVRAEQERVATVALRRERIDREQAAFERGYRKPVTRRENNYNKLVRAHFLPEEAKILTGGLGTLRYASIGQMAQERAQLYRQFRDTAAERGYVGSEFRRQWRATVMDWYATTASKWLDSWWKAQRDKGAKLQPITSERELYRMLWAWFGHEHERAMAAVKRGDLPPEAEYNKRRRKQQDFIKKEDVAKSRSVALDRRQRRIDDLEQRIDKSSSPSERLYLTRLLNDVKTSKWGLQ